VCICMYVECTYVGYLCWYVCIYVCMLVCMSVCVCVCMCMYVYVCMCVYVLAAAAKPTNTQHSVDIRISWSHSLMGHACKTGLNVNVKDAYHVCRHLHLHIHIV